MKRFETDKEIKAKSIEKAAEKFAAALTKNAREWAAEEITESVKNRYYCCSNASEISIARGEAPVSPKTNDWTYYWGIEEVRENTYYAWIIEKIEE